MADKENATTTPRPIDSAKVAALVDRLAPHLSGEMLPRPDLLPLAARQIHERLRADPGGQVAAALNRLHSHHPVWVLGETGKAVVIALDQPRIEAAIRESVARHRSIARHARELAHEIEKLSPRGGIVLAARALRGIAEMHDAYAETAAKGARFSRKKVNPRTAIIGAAARYLAARLWRKGRADREVLRLLLGAALGCAVSEAEIKGAIRSDRPTRRHSDE